jgi:hypothetical protein
VKKKLSRSSGESARASLRSNPRTHRDEATAYHEAGHAVVAYFERVPLRQKGASIIPNREDGTAGRVFAWETFGERYRPDTKNTDAARIRCERAAMVFLAGIVAQRKFNSRSVRFHHGELDFHNAVNMMGYFFESPVLEANLKFFGPSGPKSIRATSLRVAMCAGRRRGTA